MNSENALISALTYLLKYQESGCNMAGERAVMMLEAIIERVDITPELKELCIGAIDSIELGIKGQKVYSQIAPEIGVTTDHPRSGIGIPVYADLSLR
jgi:hypothetical protein